MTSTAHMREVVGRELDAAAERGRQAIATRMRDEGYDATEVERIVAIQRANHAATRDAAIATYFGGGAR